MKLAVTEGFAVIKIIQLYMWLSILKAEDFLFVQKSNNVKTLLLANASITIIFGYLV